MYTGTVRLARTGQVIATDINMEQLGTMAEHFATTTQEVVECYEGCEKCKEKPAMRNYQPYCTLHCATKPI